LQVPKWQHGQASGSYGPGYGHSFQPSPAVQVAVPQFSFSKKTRHYRQQVENWERQTRKRKPGCIDGVEASKRTDKKRQPADPESAFARPQSAVFTVANLFHLWAGLKRKKIKDA
jgi:hypothetical protein